MVLSPLIFKLESHIFKEPFVLVLSVNGKMVCRQVGFSKNLRINRLVIVFVVLAFITFL